MGTHHDNVKDKVSKDRQAKGKNNGRYSTGYYSKFNPVEKPKAKFEDLSNRTMTLEKVQELKRRISARGNTTLSSLAKEFGIKYQTIRDISRGKTYKDV